MKGALDRADERAKVFDEASQHQPRAFTVGMPFAQGLRRNATGFAKRLDIYLF